MELDKIYLGDCYQLIKNVPDKSIDLIITDPPYEFCEGGKGKSTLSDRADKELGVHYIGYELNERFWNIANERLQGISKIEKQAKEDGLIPLF